ncbi:NAD(P)-dependent alcohol dehydrogenase [Psychromicrobium lacuslunae]|uniref:Enoyl reductase (ER) domain-containing protein n=1 Tax=Psychromicrobium lacuslunae TaxID=1618207 RepID=A0A0D4C1I1_9MICC|nr:NAD(P)-dependent alcohol dehydrogenase [Psychromicrobium lacuslunae]AJT42458.1 hypothetical protein UM93_14885 [Psychromicrobium lacuslunae]
MKVTAAVSPSSTAPFVIEEVDLDEPRPEEVLVKLVATGICHTDLHAKAWSSGPIVLGHEGAGIVIAVGAAVSGLMPGDSVVLTFGHCGQCGECRRGAPAYCRHGAELNNAFGGPGLRTDGSATLRKSGEVLAGSFFGQSSFASHSVVHQNNAIKVPDGLDLAVLAALGCGFQTGAGAVLNVLQPLPESTLVIFGVGGVGFAALLAARSAGLLNIIAVDPSAERRELALLLGASAAIDPLAEDAVSKIRELSDGGASHALDTTGVPQVLSSALSSLRRRGKLVMVGIPQGPLSVDAMDLLAHGKTISGSLEGDSDPKVFIPELVGRHQRGGFSIDQLVTRYQYQEINQAVAAQKRGGSVIKPVLLW